MDRSFVIVRESSICSGIRESARSTESARTCARSSDLEQRGTVGVRVLGDDAERPFDLGEPVVPTVDGMLGIIGIPRHLIGAEIRRIGDHDGEALVDVERVFHAGTANIGVDRQAVGVAGCPCARVRAVVDLHQRTATELRGREADVAGTAVELQDRARRRGAVARSAAQRLCSSGPRARRENSIVVLDDDRPEDELLEMLRRLLVMHTQRLPVS